MKASCLVRLVGAGALSTCCAEADANGYESEPCSGRDHRSEGYYSKKNFFSFPSEVLAEIRVLFRARDALKSGGPTTAVAVSKNHHAFGPQVLLSTHAARADRPCSIGSNLGAKRSNLHIMLILGQRVACGTAQNELWSNVIQMLLGARASENKSMTPMMRWERSELGKGRHAFCHRQQHHLQRQLRCMHATNR